MNSSMVPTAHFSLHENVNERGTSNPSKGIRNTLYLKDFRFPKNFSIFFFNKKINIERDFSWNMFHCFPTNKIGMPCF